jgi:uncharacterized protein YndB with AHSA1/START domain
MSYAGTLVVAARGDHEITMTRRFGAPRAMVFEAWTKPELLKRWMTGPPGMTLPICEVDLRVGGTYRYVWRTSQGNEMGAGGTFHEVTAPERFAATERFDQPGYPGEARITITFVEQDGETEVTTTMRYESTEGRDGVMKSGMTDGVRQSYDRVAAIFEAELFARDALERRRA